MVLISEPDDWMKLSPGKYLRQANAGVTLIQCQQTGVDGTAAGRIHVAGLGQEQVLVIGKCPAFCSDSNVQADL